MGTRIIQGGPDSVGLVLKMTDETYYGFLAVMAVLRRRLAEDGELNQTERTAIVDIFDEFEAMLVACESAGAITGQDADA